MPSAAEFLAHDVCNEAQWAQVVGATIERFGGLDVLVNNAGVYQGGLLEKNSLEKVRRGLTLQRLTCGIVRERLRDPARPIPAPEGGQI